MKTFFEKLLKGFDYDRFSEFFLSVAPTGKYQLTTYSFMISATGAGINRVFGLDGYAFSALLLVFVVELASGLTAAKIKKEALSSMKLSRFSFKVACYLVLICVPYLMAVSFTERDKTLPAVIFDWLHVFLVVQIVMENMISILENIAVITGKDKTHLISKIQAKISQLLSL